MMAGSGRGSGGIPEGTFGSMLVLPPNDIALVEKAFQENDDIAAVIIEPTGAHMGTLPVYPDFIQGLREVTSRHGAVLIFDEVVTGFRISPGGAQASLGVTPDLTTLAKILGGGLPGGGVAGRRDILDMIAHQEDPAWDDVRRVAHPGTFNANPLSAAAGIAALELVATGDPTPAPTGPRRASAWNSTTSWRAWRSPAAPTAWPPSSTSASVRPAPPTRAASTCGRTASSRRA